MDAHDFMGTCNFSPNGRFIVGWSGRDRKNQGWAYGRWLLIDSGTKRLVVMGPMARPGPCYVPNDGTVLIAEEEKEAHADDHLLAVEGRASLWVAPQPPRRHFCLMKFPTVIAECGISPDGGFAFAWLGSHRQHPTDMLEDGGLLVFDLREAAEISRFVPDAGLPDSCEIDGSHQVLSMVYGEQTLRYSLGGVLLNPDDLQKVCEDREAANPYGYQIIEEAYGLLTPGGGIDAETRSRAVSLLREGLAMQVSDSTRARVHRTIGEALLQEGKNREALAEFQAALKANPKIGLKRQAEKLQQELDKRT